MFNKLVQCSLVLFFMMFTSQNLPAQEALSHKNPYVTMELLDEKVIAEDYFYTQRALFCSDGTIVCPVFLNMYFCQTLPFSVIHSLMGEDFIIRVLVSRDKGQTWAVHDTYIQPFCNNKGVRIESPAGTVGILYAFPTALSDGSYVGIGGNVVNHLLQKNQKQLPYITTLRRFQSLDDLLADKYQDEFPSIDIPGLAFQKGDSDHLYTGNIEMGPVELDNGDWLIVMTGRFKQDNIRVPYYKYEAYQFRNWVCISKDKGKSWRYLATIGEPEKNPLPELAEGYNETDLLKLPGNTILSVMQTGGHPDTEGTLKRFTYLAASFSYDSGKTWQTPKPIAPYGVSPRLLRMKNGLIVCSSGRPGVYLLFSRDDGKTWTEPQWITQYYGKRCSTGYTSIAEMDPGVLTILYDDVERNPEEQPIRQVVKMRRYSIQ